MNRSPSEGNPEAAVTLLVKDNKIVIIKRAERVDDPWSGQLGLPGGHIKNGENSKEAAIRECMEEVGIVAEIDSSLGIFVSHKKGIAVEAFLASGKVEEAKVNSEEVNRVFVIRIDDLKKEDSTYKFPGFDGVIWGLTYRIVSTYLNLGHED